MESDFQYEEAVYAGKIIGWVVCRLDKQSNISNLLYGQFSTANFPPVNGWIFLGSSVKPAVETAIECNISQDVVVAAKQNPIWVEQGEMRDNKFQGDLQGGSAATQRPNIRFYTLSNCPIQYLDGRFYESGMHQGAPVYKNVRDWYIMRQSLAEIPEIGIVAANSYRFLEGSSINAQYHTTAGM